MLLKSTKQYHIKTYISCGKSTKGCLGIINTNFRIAVTFGGKRMDQIKGRVLPVSVTFDFVERVKGRDQIFY